MIDPRYAFISAYLKGEESTAITMNQMGEMLRMDNIHDALALVRETDVGSYLEQLPVETFDDLDMLLWHYLASCVGYAESFKFSPPDMARVSRAYMAKYDVLNIKAALLGISTGRKASLIPVGDISDRGLLDELSAAEDTGKIIEILTASGLRDYVPAVESYTNGEGIKARALAEARLESAYYKSLQHMIRRVKDGSVLFQTMGMIIDLANLQIVSRTIIAGLKVDAVQCAIAGGYLITEDTVKELLSLKPADLHRHLEDTQYSDIAEEILLCHDRTRSITAVQDVIDKHRFKLLREMLAPRVLSPLVMLWYIVSKETEIRNLRLILKAVNDNVSREEIKPYLVS
ncbi:MAG: V-type ATPase subunit [Dehalococcoidia bacterium]|nr:V-type ATPase subunit [Dehalococcoidia bacterium]